MATIRQKSKENKKSASKIELNRACAVPLRSSTKHYNVIKHPVASVDLGDELTNHIYSEANKENDGNFDKPILNTLRTLSEQIQSMHLEKRPNRITSTENLSPRSKAVVIPKISQKLNFPHNKTIYRNLIPINVNDCNLLPKKKLSFRNKYITSKNKVPSPDLGDFLDPLPPLEHVILEPDINLIYDSSKVNAFEEFFEFFRDVNPRWIENEEMLNMTS